jgi:hypothetical protein
VKATPTVRGTGCAGRRKQTTIGAAKTVFVSMSGGMRRAAAYQRGDDIFFHPSNETTAGVWILSEPILKLKIYDSEKLGGAALYALGYSKINAPHPLVWKGLFDPMLCESHVKSWSAFSKSAKCVEIEFWTNRISMLPTRNLGAKAGFEPIENMRKDCSPLSKDVADTLLSAFEDCR